MDEGKNRRRQYYIKKEFQRNFILKFCLLVLTGSVISGVIIYLKSGATATTSFEGLRLVIKSTADYILPAILLSGIAVAVITVIATIFITLLTSHKIAGPLYRIEKDIDSLASGNLRQKFNLRQGDEIKPLAKALDSMTCFLSGEVTALKKNIAELELLSSSGDMPDAAKEKIKALRARIEKFKT